jgi:4-hydroxy-4-methyl-2-oxoglutarate aldolase
MTVDILKEASGLSTASLHEAAGKIGALSSAIKPLSTSFRICGKAFPVQSPPGDNLWIHRAIYAAKPGDVLVIQMAGQYENGYFGEIMAHAAIARGITGLVIDGGVRDSSQLVSMNFPVFSNGVCIRGTLKDPNGVGSLGSPVRFGDIVVHKGDLVVGDADGVMIVPQELAGTIVRIAKERDEDELFLIERLKRGETTLDIYNLPN